MARGPKKFVEPEDAPPPVEVEVVRWFRESGWAEDAEWLARAAMDHFGVVTDDSGDLAWHLKRKLEIVASARESVPRRNRALLVAFARARGCGGKGHELPVLLPSGSSAPQTMNLDLGDRARVLAETMRSHGADFEVELSDGTWPCEYGTDAEIGSWLAHECMGGSAPGETSKLLRALYFDAEINLTKVIDWRAVAESGRPYVRPFAVSDLPDRVPPYFNPGALFPVSPCSPLAWMLAIGPEALGRMLEGFCRALESHDPACLGFGLRHLIQHANFVRSRLAQLTEIGPEYAEASVPYFEALDRRVADTSSAAYETRKAWMWFARCAFEANRAQWDAFDAQRRAALLSSATADIASMRKLFARATLKPVDRDPERFAVKRYFDAHPELQTRIDTCSDPGSPPGDELASWEEFAWEQDHLRNCQIVLCRFGGIWQSLKAMLLAMRSLAAPAVWHDLRHWGEQDLPTPPQPWMSVVSTPINLFHVFAKVEQQADPDLLDLRTNLAAYCLERLVDRWSAAEREAAKTSGRPRTNDDMVERSPEWRYTLVRAFGTLGVNPKGKGHRTLHMLSDIDPDPDVREAARMAYEQARRKPKLPDGVSPRRAILSALWWLRQGHLLGLGIQLDHDGAQRTRIKELTRTKEEEAFEKANAPASQ